MRERVKGGDTRGRPVGGWSWRWGGVVARGRRWGCWLVQGVEEALISQESTTKPQLFTFKRRGDGLFLRRPPAATRLLLLLIFIFFSEQCHVLPGPAGSQRPSSALPFGTSETRSEGGRGRGKGRGSRRVSEVSTRRPCWRCGEERAQHSWKGTKQTNKQTKGASERADASKEWSVTRATSGPTFIHHHVQPVTLTSLLWFCWHMCTQLLLLQFSAPISVKSSCQQLQE